jgi:hypothetical protein
LFKEQIECRSLRGRKQELKNREKENVLSGSKRKVSKSWEELNLL